MNVQELHVGGLVYDLKPLAEQLNAWAIARLEANRKLMPVNNRVDKRRTNAEIDLEGIQGEAAVAIWARVDWAKWSAGVVAETPLTGRPDVVLASKSPPNIATSSLSVGRT